MGSPSLSPRETPRERCSLFVSWPDGVDLEKYSLNGSKLSPSVRRTENMNLLSMALRDAVLPGAHSLVEVRDGSKCFMNCPNVSVHFDHAWVIPPSLFDDSDMDPQVGPSLCPFAGISYPSHSFEAPCPPPNNPNESRLRNLLLLSPSIHSAFRNGDIHLFPITNTVDCLNDETETKIKSASKVYVSVSWDLDLHPGYVQLTSQQYFVSRIEPKTCGSLFLSDDSPWNDPMQMFTMESRDAKLPLPDPFLLRTHFRITASLHLFHVEESISKGWPSPPLFESEDIALSLASRPQMDTYPVRRLAYQAWHLSLSMVLSTGCHSDSSGRNVLALHARKPRHCVYFPSGTCGAFNSIFDFNAFLVHRYVHQETERKFRQLTPENAGFYPEYWEFTKLVYGAERIPEIREIIWEAFTEVNYDEELEAETLLWNDTPFGI
ncbi:uncharacterized protein N7473_009914 [Penicillium subrubescens]|uniref:uncharacterized protein n=1 Tax=Penicillium subrubescens TaxID=1316194 RepID=UPI002545A39F|nr:uncharacterized protein N7473_009914 [Penicillium subrubescens]KAJ5883028.1 hypothetical protein N7473_009914 [Penicillium subrubescens]